MMWRAALAAILLGSAPAHAQDTPPAPPPAPDAISAITETPCGPQRNLAGDWPALCHYRDSNHTLPPNPRAILIGDSITEGWQPTAPALFVDGVVDRGISGQTCAQMVARFYQDVVALHPRVVHIMCGTNDIAGNNGPAAPEDVTNAVLAMVDMARANGIAVVLGSIPPAGLFGWRNGYRPAPQINAFNGWLQELARRRGLVYADYHAAMADPEGAMKPGLSSDGVHPNAVGYAIMEPIARAAIAQAYAGHP